MSVIYPHLVGEKIKSKKTAISKAFEKELLAVIAQT